jgi:hypothetical protein
VLGVFALLPPDSILVFAIGRKREPRAEEKRAQVRADAITGARGEQKEQSFFRFSDTTYPNVISASLLIAAKHWLRLPQLARTQSATPPSSTWPSLGCRTADGALAPAVARLDPGPEQGAGVFHFTVAVPSGLPAKLRLVNLRQLANRRQALAATAAACKIVAARAE